VKNQATRNRSVRAKFRDRNPGNPRCCGEKLAPGLGLEPR
jgi:hypothetical protein